MEGKGTKPLDYSIYFDSDVFGLNAKTMDEVCDSIRFFYLKKSNVRGMAGFKA